MSRARTECLIWAMTVLSLVSCNIYAPFQGSSSLQDYLEEANKCLREGDLACARAQYLKLDDGPLKYEKLCEVGLSLAGFRLDAMIDHLQLTNGRMLGAVANALLPYTAEKLAAAEETIKSGGYCDLYLNDPSGGNEAVLLKSIAYVTHCALLMAKVDDFVAVSNDLADPCTAPGKKKWTILRGDIADGGSTSGIIVEQGMCGAEVLKCRDDMVNLKALKIRLSENFSRIKAAYEAIPQAIAKVGDDVLASEQVRGGIQETFGGN